MPYEFQTMFGPITAKKEWMPVAKNYAKKKKKTSLGAKVPAIVTLSGGQLHVP